MTLSTFALFVSISDENDWQVIATNTNRIFKLK